MISFYRKYGYASPRKKYSKRNTKDLLTIHKRAEPTILILSCQTRPTKLTKEVLESLNSRISIISYANTYLLRSLALMLKLKIWIKRLSRQESNLSRRSGSWRLG